MDDNRREPRFDNTFFRHKEKYGEEKQDEGDGHAKRNKRWNYEKKKINKTKEIPKDTEERKQKLNAKVTYI